jgi:hypothetical protein
VQNLAQYYLAAHRPDHTTPATAGRLFLPLLLRVIEGGICEFQPHSQTQKWQYKDPKPTRMGAKGPRRCGAAYLSVREKRFRKFADTKDMRLIW